MINNDTQGNINIVHMYRRKPQRKEYVRIHVGDVQFTDDINDDWFCISFNSVYIGDFVPNCIYINKKNGVIRIFETSLFVRLLSGFFVHRAMCKYKFQEHHRLILEKFVNDTFKQYHKDGLDSISKISIENIMITMSQQRV
jgi:hypothetical protein